MSSADSAFAGMKEWFKYGASRSDLIKHRVNRALVLRPRGGVAKDILLLKQLFVHLRVEWFARDVHPWDRDLPQGRQSELFTQQCLEDVDAAIPRLFKELPEIDEIEIRVLDRESNAQIITGVINRENARVSAGLSLGMRLNALGVNYRRSNFRLEPIP
jgi:hypothetical protein